jgi:hypothetical protein
MWNIKWKYELKQPSKDRIINFTKCESKVKESDNESDRILGCGPTFGSLVLESDGILVPEFDGTYRWVLTDLYY